MTRDSNLPNLESELWSDVIDVNLSGSMNFIKVFVEQMKHQKFGKIILSPSI
ncbi:MAG: SDR family NAD(P)-dependent oxidoreductase [Oscillospiraceae bacterium]|nr:SDR family NAD(P)-dependent oxidoreductase [Oscillospiraceae bacterium]